jgi:hypothetical protein
VDQVSGSGFILKQLEGANRHHHHHRTAVESNISSSSHKSERSTSRSAFRTDPLPGLSPVNRVSQFAARVKGGVERAKRLAVKFNLKLVKKVNIFFCNLVNFYKS